jgi:rubredoxin
MLINIQKYMCPNCGWTGYEEEMESDYMEGDGGESFSDCICPKCQLWWELKDYEMVK